MVEFVQSFEYSKMNSVKQKKTKLKKLVLIAKIKY